MTERNDTFSKGTGKYIARPLAAAILALSGTFAGNPSTAYANHASCEQNGTLMVEHNPGNNLDCVNAQRMLDLHNNIRAQHGLQSLSVDPVLTRAAEDYANFLLAPGVNLSHDHQGGTWKRLETNGFKIMGATGENLASGSNALPPEVHFQALMDSYGHRVNILQPTYNIVGVAAAQWNGEIRYVIIYSERQNPLVVNVVPQASQPIFSQEPVATLSYQPPVPNFAPVQSFEPIPQPVTQPINPHTGSTR